MPRRRSTRGQFKPKFPPRRPQGAREGKAGAGGGGARNAPGGRSERTGPRGAGRGRGRRGAAAAAVRGIGAVARGEGEGPARGAAAATVREDGALARESTGGPRDGTKQMLDVQNRLLWGGRTACWKRRRRWKRRFGRRPCGRGALCAGCCGPCRPTRDLDSRSHCRPKHPAQCPCLMMGVEGRDPGRRRNGGGQCATAAPPSDGIPRLHIGLQNIGHVDTSHACKGAGARERQGGGGGAAEHADNAGICGTGAAGHPANALEDTPSGRPRRPSV